ncbi:TniQ family protein [Rhizobium mongolense]|uniref:TniQ domain-containing protein n=2 Tax=Rhizobium mongolense TaxID=57676 RepID=A0ABR6IWB3_9HYPH|nr:TniQ family protein [Rhizobium mongolense]MBB4232202.1 hypothetical protein [Rhizobium mongolense]TVZ63078.1 TniQ protein [Rhizobium mongolense USDA 1844]
MVRLAHVPDLAKTEAFQSFLPRLAAVNGAASLQEFRRHFALKSHQSSASKELISEISRLTGISESILDAHQLLNVSGHGQLGHAKLRWSNLHTTSARYCPICVQNDYLSGSDRRDARPWVRGGWYGLNNYVCVEHSVELFTSPIPYSAANRWDFTSHLRENPRELDEAARSAKSHDPLPYDVYFDHRLTRNVESVQLLDPLPYHIAYSLCELLGQMKLLGNSPHTVDAAPARMHDARCVGFDLLADRGKLLQFLDELRGRHLARIKTSSRYHVYGPFQRYLSQLLQTPGARPLIDLVREHAMSALPIGPNDDFIGGGGCRKWHTIRTAKLEYDIDPRLMRKLLIERGLIGDGEAISRDNHILIPADKVQELASYCQDGVDLQYVRETFGILESTARQLVNAGIISPLYGSSKGIKAKFSRTAIDATLRDVLSGLPERNEDGNLISLVDATRLGGRSVSNLIVAILEGRLPTRFLTSRTDRTGFMRLLLDPTEIRAEFVKPVGIKRHEFTAIFRFRPLEGDKFFYSKFFERSRETSPTNHREFDVVTRGSLERFQQVHVSLAALSKGRGRPVDVKNMLNEAGINPVWEIKGRRALTFYKRSEVEEFLRSLA